MLGRLVQNNPFCLKDVDRLFYNETNKYIISEKNNKRLLQTLLDLKLVKTPFIDF